MFLRSLRTTDLNKSKIIWLVRIYFRIHPNSKGISHFLRLIIIFFSFFEILFATYLYIGYSHLQRSTYFFWLWQYVIY